MEMLLVLSLMALLQAGNVSSISLRNVLRSSSTYTSDVTETIYRMADMDQDGALSASEIQAFRGTPGLESEIKNAFNEESREQADSNGNGLLERYEVQSMLSTLPRNEAPPIARLLKLVFVETKSLIARGVIKLPETNIEKAVVSLYLLDKDDNEMLSREELREFFDVIGTDMFWREVLQVVEMADVNDDGELNKSELIGFYEESGPEFSATILPPMFTYFKIVKMLGAFPTIFA